MAISGECLGSVWKYDLGVNRVWGDSLGECFANLGLENEGMTMRGSQEEEGGMDWGGKEMVMGRARRLPAWVGGPEASTPGGRELLPDCPSCPQHWSGSPPPPTRHSGGRLSGPSVTSLAVSG